MYLGIDCSTQSMSGMLYNPKTGKIILDVSIEYKERFPQYNFSVNSETNECTANPILWVLALEELLNEFKHLGINLSEIKGISGAAQQHATVYLNSRFVNSWAWQDNLANTIQPMLAIERSPIWMDQSTSQECLEITNKLPNKNYALQTSGSVITRRFSGPQIARFAKLFPINYAQTSIVHLLSSFLTSIMIGQSSAIDISDASGMNLLNLENLNWDQTLVKATHNELHEKLPKPINANHIAGKIAPYFVEKYGFSPNTSIVYFTGDNISSSLGIGCNDSSIFSLSLGTSDTMFIYNKTFSITSESCNTFYHPNGGFISLVCFQNGAFSRDKIRNMAGYNWAEFDNSLTKTKAGNNGILQLPFYTAEINPFLPQGSSISNRNRSLTPAESIRAVLESQAINYKIQSDAFSQQLKKIIVTGGGSNCDGFCQIIADVFQCDVLRFNSANSVQLGGISRAMAVVENKPIQVIDEIKTTTKPKSETKNVYLELQKTMESMLKDIMR